MKILQINTVYKTGSTGGIMANMHRMLSSSGFDSYVAYGRGNHNEKNTIRIGNSLDKYLHAIGTRIFDKHGLYSKNATAEFIAKIDKLDIDIVHLHNIHGYYLNYEILFNYLASKKTKVIWTLHDCWSFTGHCSYYDYIGCNKWQTICNHCPQKNKYPLSYVMDNSNNNFLLKSKLFSGLDNLTIVTPSKWLAGEVGKSFLRNYPVKIINNGVDLTVFKQIKNDFREKNNLENKFLILGVANIWEARKGLDYFLRLSKTLNADEKIILVGLNDTQINSLPRDIIGIKKTHNTQELADIYSTADVFVNPTLEDNLPTTNLESLACNTPVITFNSGGSAECVDKNCGIVVAKEDFDHLRFAIQKIKQKPEKYSTFCRDRAEKYFNKEQKFQEYIKLYKTI